MLHAGLPRSASETPASAQPVIKLCAGRPRRRWGLRRQVSSRFDCTLSPTCASQSSHSGGPRAGAMREGWGWESRPMWSRILLVQGLDRLPMVNGSYVVATPPLAAHERQSSAMQDLPDLSQLSHSQKDDLICRLQSMLPRQAVQIAELKARVLESQARQSMGSRNSGTSRRPSPCAWGDAGQLADRRAPGGTLCQASQRLPGR